MSTRVLLCIFITSFIYIAISCSSGESDLITSPPDSHTPAVSEFSGTTACFGLWQVTADKAAGTIEAIPLRGADYMLNVLSFMEPPALSSMDLDWENLKFGEGTVDVGVILKHPIPDAVFTGFDVRGVCFGPEVANADGLTVAMSPEFFSGVLFGYQDGLLGAPDSYGEYSGLAGYKYYCTEIDEDDELPDFFSNPANLDNRGSFPAGGIIQRNYQLDWNNVDLNFLTFNYAIYANYDWPVADPPIEVDDFSIATANGTEAFCISVTETANDLWYYDSDGGGEISLQLEVWDWQGDITTVTMEFLSEIGNTPGVLNFTPSGAGATEHSYLYDISDVAVTPLATTDIDILITTVDAKTYGEAWFQGLLPASHEMYDENVYNCWIYTTTVSDENPLDCGEMGSVTSTSYIYGPWFYSLNGGVACTRLGDSYVVNSYFYSGRLMALRADSTTAYQGPPQPPNSLSGTFSGTQRRDIVSDSNNIIYFVTDADYTLLRQILHTPLVGFGPPGTFGNIPSPWSIWRITVDPYDNPVILAYNTGDNSLMRIFHWNGSSWDELDVPSLVVNGDYNIVNDYDYNPYADDYVFMCKMTSGLTNMYAIDTTTGTLTSTINDVFDFNHDVEWDPGIYIDPVNPDCHFAVWGGAYIDGEWSETARPIALYNAVYERLSTGQGSAGGASYEWYAGAGVRGAWAPGTNRLFTGGRWNQAFISIYYELPAEW